MTWVPKRIQRSIVVSIFPSCFDFLRLDWIRLFTTSMLYVFYCYFFVFTCSATRRIFVMCLFCVWSSSHDYPALLVSIVYCSIGKTTNKRHAAFRPIALSLFLFNKHERKVDFKKGLFLMFSGFNKTIIPITWFFSLPYMEYNGSKKLKRCLYCF